MHFDIADACSPTVMETDDDAAGFARSGRTRRPSIGSGSSSSGGSFPCDFLNWVHVHDWLGDLEEAQIPLAKAPAGFGPVVGDLLPRHQQASDTGGMRGTESAKSDVSDREMQQHSNAAVVELTTCESDLGSVRGSGGSTSTGSVGAEQAISAAFWPCNYPWLLLGTAAAAATALWWCSSGMSKSKRV